MERGLPVARTSVLSYSIRRNNPIHCYLERALLYIIGGIFVKPVDGLGYMLGHLGILIYSRITVWYRRAS
jgi:hypothetical protein